MLYFFRISASVGGVSAELLCGAVRRDLLVIHAQAAV